MSKQIELTPSQRRRCNRLIKRLCANYDDGNCLPLDEGDGCVCVQMISLSLICKYFRNAVLPADKELYADIFKQRTYHCAECRAAFVPNSNRQKYCRIAGRKTRAQESAKRTIRNPQMLGLQGLSQAETRQESIIYQNL